MKNTVRRWMVPAVCAAAAMTLVTGCAESTDAAQASTGTTAETVSEASDASGSTVTVTATSTDYADPDIADIQFGIEATEDTAQESQDAANATSEDVKKALVDLGISEDSISTSSYSLYPRYDYNTGDGTEIIGYDVDLYLTVKDVPLDQVGDVLSEATSAGVTQISNISYTSSSYDDVYSSAITQAVSDARAKAQTLAEAEGKTLGELVTVEEGYQDTSARYLDSGSYSTMAAEESKSTGTSVNIDPGQLEVSATVTATYRLQ